MKKDIICGLDIGTAKLCVACGALDPSGKIDILASHTVPTPGIKVGRIIDSKKLSAAIKDVTKRLRKNWGIKVHRVYTNIDSPDLRAKACVEKVSFGENVKIKRFHIENLINSAISSHVSLDRKVIHTGFRNFILDNQANSIYPEGRNANKLELNIVIVSALIPTINGFVKCIQDAGLILEDIVPSGCAQAPGLFRDFEQNIKDNILIDVGAGLTKITLLEDKLVKDLSILPVGAQSITEDIAARLKVSFDCAEELKIKYGLSFSENRHFHQKIIVKDKLTKKFVQPHELHEIITSKVDYLLQEMEKALSGLNNRDKKITEIIFTGGGSILEGFLERAEKILGKKVKMGFLYAIKDNRIQSQSAIYATSIGLIQFGFNKNRDYRSFYARAKFAPFMGILNWAKQLHREYF